MGTHLRRKNIRLPRNAYEIPSQIFSITICTWNRRPVFQKTEWARVAFDSLSSGPFSRKTDRYASCLMPDHLHLLIAPTSQNLIDILSRWKSYTANQIRKTGLDGRCWQRGFYDHALRRDEDIYSTAEYIVHNPVRAKIVAKWRHYPFAWHRWM